MTVSCGTFPGPAVVQTVPERCKRCYCCVRECPARAIQIERGQAVVIGNRCIGCGNCIKVCTQSAKAVARDAARIAGLLQHPGATERIALLAPSFPAAFPEYEPLRIVGALAGAGFTRILEVAFGADLVSAAYADHVRIAQGPVITTPCPAIVEYIQKYHPSLIPGLAPLVSPMIAAARVARERYGRDALVVFIGPCVAKKLEIADAAVRDEVDAALTFDEAEELFALAGADPSTAVPREFDQPRANLGQIYPVSGGLLSSAGLSADVMDEAVIVVEGRERCINIIDELEQGKVSASMIDILFCEGCINGPGMRGDLSYFEKRERIIRFVRERTRDLNTAIWRNHMLHYRATRLARSYSDHTVAERQPSEEEIRRVLAATGKSAVADELNCGACGYATCRGLATAVAQGLAESEMCLPFLIDTLERSHRELAEAQEQLVHSEKLASVGQLAAGVAHEINNPLGTILLYSHLLLKQVDEADPARDDLRFIIEEAERCRNIVASLLNFARQGKLSVTECRADDLLGSIVAMLERREDFAGVRLVTRIDGDIPVLYLDAEQMKQVLLNLAINGCEAMPRGGTLTLAAHANGDAGDVVFTVADTGIGIPRENMNRLFTPFFTTKQIGKGTGLGLPIAYGIVKMHRGRIQVRSKAGEGTVFSVTLPLDARNLPSSGFMGPADFAAALTAAHPPTAMFGSVAPYAAADAPLPGSGPDSAGTSAIPPHAQPPSSILPS